MKKWLIKLSVMINLWFLGYCFKHNCFKHQGTNLCYDCENLKFSQSMKEKQKYRDNKRARKTLLVEKYNSLK